MASISDRVGDLGEYLREQREHARLSVRQLATLAGVSNPYLSQVERGLRKPSAEVLQQIARGLQVSAEALYVRAGILDSEGRPDVGAAVAADPELSDRQRRVLLDIYESFRAENRRAAPEEPEAPSRRRPATQAAARVVKVRKAAGRRRAAGADATRPDVVQPDADASDADASDAAHLVEASVPDSVPDSVPGPTRRSTPRAAREPKRPTEPKRPRTPRQPQEPKAPRATRVTRRSTRTPAAPSPDGTASPSAPSTGDPAPGGPDVSTASPAPTDPTS